MSGADARRTDEVSRAMSRTAKSHLTQTQPEGHT